MRIAWVHPSWRDLVIEHLGEDGDARVRYLRSSSIHGALLALSAAGGAAGARHLPLLKADRDWDAVNDRVYELVPELEAPELVGLLRAVASTIENLRTDAAGVEANALGRMVLSRVSDLWAASHTPVAVTELEAWFELAAVIAAQPAPPAIAMTWVELVPAAPPDISDYRSLERFADWLALAELLQSHAPELLPRLGFPREPPQPITAFLAALTHDDARRRLQSIDQARRALGHIGRLFPRLAERSRSWSEANRCLRADDDPFAAGPAPRHLSAPRQGQLDVERVLSDL